MTVDIRAVPATAGRVRINVEAGRIGGRVVALTDATAPLRRMAGTTLGLAIAAGGARLLPRARTADWTGATPAALEEALARFCPGFRLLGLVAPRQPGRRHLMVIGRSSGIVVVAKIDGDGATLQHEANVLAALARRPIPSIVTPDVLEVGRLELVGQECSVMITGSVAKRSAPAFGEALRLFERQLTERLGAVLPRPAGTPAHWVPAHHDVSPWNLRRTERGLALFDWELTGYAPPGVDVAYYRCCNATMDRMEWPDVDPEVADHLLDMIERRNEAAGGPLPGSIDFMISEHLVQFAGQRASDPRATTP